LVAYQEVEDQLAGLRILTGEAQSTADAVTNAQRAETIALNRYRGGLVSYLDVIYAQTALLSNQRTATQIGGQRMVATVVLIKALGGGWLGVPAQTGTNPSSGAPTTGANATVQPALTAGMAK
jgi:multidrug efflux system outer membrane protein